VADGERHVEDAGERAGQEGLAAAGGADEQDVALLDLDFAGPLVAQCQALVVVVDGDRQNLLGAVLANDVLVHLLLDVAGRGDVGERGLATATAAFFLFDDRLAQFDTFAADVDVAGTFDQRADFAVILPAEGAICVAVAAGAPHRLASPPARARVFGRHAV